MKKFWQFRNATDDPQVGELLLYGDISSTTWWGDEITPKQFKEDLDALGGVSTIRVYINSGGGDTFAGQAIYSMLKRHKAAINVYVDGLAASIASVIAMAGDKVYMPVNSMMMIHNPWTLAIGDANDFRELADILDQVRKTIIATYQAKTGLAEEKIIELMDAETWMTAKEAVEYGFADEIEEARQIAASLSDKSLIMNGQQFDLSRFKHVPKVAALKTVPTVKNGVVPNDVSRKKAPEDEPWEAPTLSDFTDEPWDDLSDAEKRRIAGHYAWAAAMPPERFGDLKLPHHRPSDGAVVWRGVANAAARLPQSDIPSEDVPGVQAHLGSHYRQFNRTPPWEEQEDAWKEYIQASHTLIAQADLDWDVAARWLVLRTSLFSEFTSESRVLFAANEQRIRQARDALNEVLGQLDQKDKQTDTGLLSLYAAKVKVNKNKVRR